MVQNQIDWRARAKKDHEDGKVPFPKVGVLRGPNKLPITLPGEKAATAGATFPVGQTLPAAAVRQPAPAEPMKLAPPAPVTETASISVPAAPAAPVEIPAHRRKRSI